ncbi:MAG: DUF1684 domain-containing protein [Acidobacteriota bacterium]|nr:DUF1684 domain-containing protein [Acidobacteriota bacterium]
MFSLLSTGRGCAPARRARWRLVSGIAAVLIAGAACSPPRVPYADDINAWRATKDQFMRESEDSPVLPAQRASFPPLTYYPISEAYRVPAALTVAASNTILEIPTSTGKRRAHRRIGRLEFTLQGQPMTLTAFVEAGQQDMRRLFVPFGDPTNGTETYPGGRYLELDRTATGIYDLDFNRAYHPFCYYNPAFDCPYPPRENRLAIPVRAGEKSGPGEHKEKTEG